MDYTYLKIDLAFSVSSLFLVIPNDDDVLLDLSQSRNQNYFDFEISQFS